VSGVAAGARCRSEGRRAGGGGRPRAGLWEDWRVAAVDLQILKEYEGDEKEKETEKEIPSHTRWGRRTSTRIHRRG
jgi:hypothetical protein